MVRLAWGAIGPATVSRVKRSTRSRNSSADWRTTRGDYVPELWQLAVHEDEIAGAALGFGGHGLGWILDLAVGPRWRRRGLGLALLRAAFRPYAPSAF